MSNHTQYTVAIVGCGRVARKHAKAIRNLKDDLRLIALVDGKIEACKNLNDSYKLRLEASSFFHSIEEMYASGLRPDIIAINTPSGSHFSLAKYAMRCGAHILLEKPMTLRLEEARQLEAMSRQLHKKIAMGHIYRFFPFVDLIREDILSGKLGKVLHAEVKVHWGHDQAYYDQAAWRGSWSADGGALMNQTIHALDLMLWILGHDAQKIQGAISQRLHKMEAEDYGAALITLDDGAILRLAGTTTTSEKRHAASFYICMEQVEIEAGLQAGVPYIRSYARGDSAVKTRYRRRFLKQLVSKKFIKTIKSYLNPHMGIYMDLVQALRNDTDVRAGASSGVSSVENVLAIYRSALENGNTVKLPMKDFSLDQMQNFFQDK